MRSTLIFTATYNEADNISALMADIWSHSSDSDILVVDDNSPDGTGAILDDIQKRSDGKLQVIHRPRKLGLGNAHKLAMKYAVENGYDYLITMDADFSHNPKYIPTIMECILDCGKNQHPS